MFVSGMGLKDFEVLKPLTFWLNDLSTQLWELLGLIFSEELQKSYGPTCLQYACCTGNHHGAPYKKIYREQENMYMCTSMGGHNQQSGSVRQNILQKEVTYLEDTSKRDWETYYEHCQSNVDTK